MNETESFLDDFGGGNGSAPISVGPDTLGFLEEFNNGGISESYKFYNDTVEIIFDVKEHQYFRVGDLGQLILLLNVSTVSHIVDRSFALMPWAVKVGFEKLLRIVPVVDGVVQSMPLTSFVALCNEAKKAHKEVLEDAGEVGTEAHAWIEQSIKKALQSESKTVNYDEPILCKDPRATNSVQAAFHWMKRHNVRWFATERKVFSRTHDFSGTMDGRCLTDSCNDLLCCPKPFKDKHTLADWKTSNYLKIEYLFQTAAYEFAHEEEFPDDQIDDRWVLRLGKEEGEFEPWHLTEEDFEDDWQGYLACLNLKRLVMKIEERTSSRKKYVREAKKEAEKIVKALAKEAEKAAKAVAKAEEKLRKQEEKKRKAEEAKAERERIKAEIKKEKELKKKPAILVETTLEQTGEPNGVEPVTNQPEVRIGDVNPTDNQSPGLILQPSPSLGENEWKPFLIPTEE